MDDCKRRRISTVNKLHPLELSSDEIKSLKAEYELQRPFPYIKLASFCDDSSLHRVRDQLISQFKVDYKETDIFKVLQSSDLANLDSTDVSIKDVLELRDAIYSAEFRSFVESITGCPKLMEKADCSCNIYPQGGHLLCHDDVIGTRAVSYILYLTDPESDWQETDGGALELYSIDSQGEPEPTPVKRILPCWNQMVMFRVQPGVSFHSVEEVLTDTNHRLSISGWFHSAENTVLGTDQLSTLNQLKDASHLPTESSFMFQTRTGNAGLSTEDVEYLGKWVNEIYLVQESIEKIYRSFQEEGSIQLQDFLNQELLSEISTLLPEADREDSILDGGWKINGPPHKQRYLKFNTSQIEDESKASRLGLIFQRIKTQLFQSKSFISLLHELTGLTCLAGHSEIRSFRPGSDYTIALYKDNKPDTLDAVLCFVNESDEETKAKWEYGEIGGFEAYLLADTKQEAAADVYKADDEDSGVLSVNPVANTLNLVLSDKGLIKFVKYISAAAPGNRWDISAEYQVQETEEQDDEEEED
eukprot:g2365.t1